LRFRRSRPRDRGSNLALWPGDPGPLDRAGRLPDRAAAGARRAAGHRGRADDRAEELLQGATALRAGAATASELGAPGAAAAAPRAGVHPGLLAADAARRAADPADALEGPAPLAGSQAGSALTLSAPHPIPSFQALCLESLCPLPRGWPRFR